MTYQQLLEKTKDIDLERLCVFLGKRSNLIDSVSLYREGDEWVERHIDDRQNTFEIRGTEEDVCESTYMYIRMKLELGY